jgi:hypothetical protein
MAKITISDIQAGFMSQNAINEAFNTIEAEFQNKVLYRNNTSGEANQMENDIDMNNNDLINVGLLSCDGVEVGGNNLEDALAALEGIDESLAAIEASEAAATAAASSASASASSASASATTASNAATSAASSLAGVEAIFDSFDDRYLGAKASDPTVDNDGNPLLAGATYWNTTSSVLKFYNGAAWEAPSSSAATSATNALNSANAAASSATSALNAKNAAEAAYDSFDDRYLGSKSSAPSVDNDGNTLLEGAIYWNTTLKKLYIWDGTAWDEAAFNVSGTGVSSFNTRTGAVTLTSGDVTGALGFTPISTESDPIYAASSWYSTVNNSSNWNTAYGWGDHASAGYVTASSTVTLTNKTLTDPALVGTILEDVYTATTASSTLTIDPGNGSVQVLTLGQNATSVSLTNFAAGESVTLMIADGTAYSITWSTSVTWVGGTTPTLPTSGYAVIQLWKVSSTVYGVYVGNVA